MTRLPSESFVRENENPDTEFYSEPRLAPHIDEWTRGELTNFYDSKIPDGAHVLDLMSSFYSHFPESRKYRTMGLGLNREEMEKNDQLDQQIVHDINRNPKLPFGDEQFDFVTCAVAVQYMIRPYEVFLDVHRLLKSGGMFIVSFSRKCFPTKTVAIWGKTDAQQRINLVINYFQQSAMWSEINTTSKTGNGDPLYIVWGVK